MTNLNIINIRPDLPNARLLIEGESEGNRCDVEFGDVEFHRDDQAYGFVPPDVNKVPMNNRCSCENHTDHMCDHLNQMIEYLTAVKLVKS